MTFLGETEHLSGKNGVLRVEHFSGEIKARGKRQEARGKRQTRSNALELENVHWITIKEIMAPFFSINKAWGKFLELDAPFSLVLNRLKAMQLIVLLKWKNIVQEF